MARARFSIANPNSFTSNRKRASSSESDVDVHVCSSAFQILCCKSFFGVASPMRRYLLTPVVKQPKRKPKSRPIKRTLLRYLFRTKMFIFKALSRSHGPVPKLGLLFGQRYKVARVIDFSSARQKVGKQGAEPSAQCSASSSDKGAPPRPPAGRPSESVSLPPFPPRTSEPPVEGSMAPSASSIDDVKIQFDQAMVVDVDGALPAPEPPPGPPPETATGSAQPSAATLPPAASSGVPTALVHMNHRSYLPCFACSGTNAFSLTLCKTSHEATKYLDQLVATRHKGKYARSSGYLRGTIQTSVAWREWPRESGRRPYTIFTGGAKGIRAKAGDFDDAQCVAEVCEDTSTWTPLKTKHLPPLLILTMSC